MAVDILQRAGVAMVLILASLAEGPKHGYALITDIEAFSGTRLGPGSLYGALSRLEELGLIRSLPASNRRQPYEVTPEGLAALRTHVDALERVSAAGRARLGLLGSS